VKLPDFQGEQAELAIEKLVGLVVDGFGED